ncbi:MAG: hypothetical protein Kow0063_35280 [Anaerolineae bacterium]
MVCSCLWRLSQLLRSPEAILERIEAIMRELAELRQMVLRIQPEPAAGDLAQQLYGALGHGSWEEYDLPDFDQVPMINRYTLTA